MKLYEQCSRVSRSESSESKIDDSLRVDSESIFEQSRLKMANLGIFWYQIGLLIFTNSSITASSVRPKPKFRPKFRSKSAETFRPNLSVNLPKTETAKKRHFGEFLALFWLMFKILQHFFQNLIRNFFLITYLKDQIKIPNRFSPNKKLVQTSTFRPGPCFHVIFGRISAKTFRPKFRSTWPKFRFRPKLIFPVSVVH